MSDRREPEAGCIPFDAGAGLPRPTTSVAEPAGVWDVMQLQASTQGAELCALGHHAWVPWLQLDNGSFVTWCVRKPCDHSEQYDP